MATNRVHFRHIRGTGRARSACGRMINANYLSADPVDVTCVKCTETGSYRHARRNRPAVVNIAATPIDPTMKKILDAVFEKAAEIAEDQRLCETYDDIIDEIADSGVLPTEYDIPGRERDWTVKIKGISVITATSIVEAKKIFIEEFDRHFSIERY